MLSTGFHLASHNPRSTITVRQLDGDRREYDDVDGSRSLPEPLFRLYLR